MKAYFKALQLTSYSYVSSLSLSFTLLMTHTLISRDSIDQTLQHFYAHQGNKRKREREKDRERERARMKAKAVKVNFSTKSFVNQ